MYSKLIGLVKRDHNIHESNSTALFDILGESSSLMAGSDSDSVVSALKNQVTDRVSDASTGFFANFEVYNQMVILRLLYFALSVQLTSVSN